MARPKKYNIDKEKLEKHDWLGKDPEGKKLVYRTTKGSIGLSKPKEGPVSFYLGRGFQSPKYNANVGFNVSPNEVGLSFGGQFY